MASRSIFRAFGDRWRERVRFETLGSWMLHVYNRVLLRIPNAPLPGRGAVRAISLAGRPGTFLARLGTTDFHVLEEVYALGEYAHVLGLDLGESPLIVDLGANVGYSVRLWLEHWPRATVVAVEPDTANAAMCRRNIEGWAFSGKATLVEACVAARERRVNLDRTRGEWAYSMGADAALEEDRDTSAGAVDAVTLPSLLQALGLSGRRIDLLKCDIEGAEQELFGDCAAWLPRVHAAVVELHGEYDQAKFLRDIDRTGERFHVTVAKVLPDLRVLVLRREPPDEH